MDLFGLDKQEIEVLFLKRKNLTSTQIQQRLHISSSEFFDRQKSALTKLEIPGEPKEKWGNFEKSSAFGILAKLTEDDITNWNERRDDLRKRFAASPWRTSFGQKLVNQSYFSTELFCDAAKGVYERDAKILFAW